MPCKKVLARPDKWETCPCYFSLHLFTMVTRSSGHPTACWIWAWTSSLITWSLYEMHSILQQHLISIVCILLSSSAMRVFGAPQMILQSVSSIFPVFHCPLGLGKLQACPFSDVVFPHFPLSALSFSPFHCFLARWFWPDLMNGRHDHTSAVCISLRWSGGIHAVRLPAGSWHRLSLW